MLSSRKWTLRPVVWIPLLIRLQNCGIYYHRTSRKLIPYSSSIHFYQNGTDRNSIVTVVIYATLTMFKWCHIDSSLFYIFPPLVIPYASNACTVILFMWYVLIQWVLHWRSIAYFIDVDILIIDNCHVCFLWYWISLYSMCVFFKCLSSHLSPVSYHPSPSSSRLIAFWLMLPVCSLCDTK